MLYTLFTLLMGVIIGFLISSFMFIKTDVFQREYYHLKKENMKLRRKLSKLKNDI